MPDYLLDASVLHAYVNKQDAHHQKAENFFVKNFHAKYIIPVHCMFELEATRSRRGREDTFTPLKVQDNIALAKVKYFDIDKEFLEYCEKQNLFELFGNLRGGDLIYACVARKLDIVLVTFDNDFDDYQHELKLLKV